MQVKNCYLLPRDRQLEEPVAHCDVCGAELYEGEQAFYDNGQEILCCKDCVLGVTMKYLVPVTVGEED